MEVTRQPNYDEAAELDEQVSRESKVVDLWNSGKSLRAIGLEIGKSHTYVRDVLHDHGIETSDRRTRDTSERDNRIIELYGASERPTIKDVANAVGLSYNTVQAVLSRAGVTRDRGRPKSDDPKRDRRVISYRPDEATLARIQAVAELDRIPLDTVIDYQVKRAIEQGYL